MSAPQWIVLGWLFAESMASFAYHGRKVEVTIDFRLATIKTLGFLYLLTLGGFF